MCAITFNKNLFTSLIIILTVVEAKRIRSCWEGRRRRASSCCTQTCPSRESKSTVHLRSCTVSERAPDPLSIFPITHGGSYNPASQPRGQRQTILWGRVQYDSAHAQAQNSWTSTGKFTIKWNWLPLSLSAHTPLVQSINLFLLVMLQDRRAGMGKLQI